MEIFVVPILAMLAGLALWAFAEQHIAKEAGRLLFACGLLLFLIQATAAADRFIPKEAP